MIEAGVLGPADRVELLGGMIVAMSPAGPAHNHVVMRLNRLFSPCWDRAEIAVQGTLLIGDNDVFDPDLMLLRPRPEGYREALPRPADVLLLVEVADASLRKDRQIKLPIYAAAGIAEYWIADIEHESIEIHRAPAGERYEQLSTVRDSERATPQAIAGLSVTPVEVFGVG